MTLSTPGFRAAIAAFGLVFPFVVVSHAAAQAAAPQSPSSSQAVTAPAPAPDDDEAVLDPAEPDYVVVNIPTTLRLPLHKSYFRLTHRFAGNLRNGTFAENAGNLFGLDQGAIIGFEYRVAVVRHVETAVYRSSFDKTIQIYGKYDALHQGASSPVSVSAIVSYEGTNNFREKFAPALGVVVSRKIAHRLAAYVAPVWVNNTAASLDAIAHQHTTDGTDTGSSTSHIHRSTTYVGLGGRARIANTVYLVGEITPRLSGYAPDVVEYGFGIEKRVGGHAFSLTFTNTFGTTFAQLARGGTANSLYLGFNLARKFF